MIKIGHGILIGYWLLVIGIFPGYAQDNEKLTTLTKQIMEAEASPDLYGPFAEIKELYYQDHSYAEFISFLESLSGKNAALAPFVNYYTALTSYQQLKYLEETQNWDEYFNQGNLYRQQVTEGLEKAINSTASKDALNLYSRLLLWQFHKDQEDTQQDAALSGLMSALSEYVKEPVDISAIKEVADKLSAYNQKAVAKGAYKLYVDKLISQETKDEQLASIAGDFYGKGNLDLAESIYDVYLEKISQTMPKQELIAELFALAKNFTYKDEAPNDPLYAEKIFSKIEGIAGKEAFDEESMYLRGLNLEKAREYALAKQTYQDLIEEYPRGAHTDEVDFKLGVISAYISKDTKTAVNYFEKLAQKEENTAQKASGLYQLGLINQWQQDLVKAKDYYQKLLALAPDSAVETVQLAKERLQEIEESRPMEYSIKTFLDVSLKEEYAALDMTKLDLKAKPFRIKKGEPLEIKATPYVAESGCLQVQLQYLWSGDLGTAKPSSDEPMINTTYTEPGIKIINVVVVSSSGIIDRNIDLVDVY